MASSSADVVIGFGPVKGRKRARTQSLLGSEYEETITRVVPPPMPLQDLEHYDSDRVRQGLKYADSTLRNPQRQISPGGILALDMYKDTCAKLLDLLDDKEGKKAKTTPRQRRAVVRAHRAFVREAEKEIQMTACMQATGSESAEEFHRKIMDLEQVSFYARYGDYFAKICNELKVSAEREKLPGWRTLSRTYWSDIARKVQLEKPTYDAFCAGRAWDPKDMPTTQAIQTAAYNIGLDPRDTLEIINHYGKRNDLLHANLLPLIKEGNFHTLSRTLYRDRTDIPLILPIPDRDIMEKMLDTFIDLWFDKGDLDPSNYETWNAKDELKEKYKALNSGSSVGTEAKINEDIQREITKAYKANLRKSHDEDKLATLFSCITGKQQPPKRVAASQFDEELQILKERRKKWGAIMNLIYRAKSLYDAYILTGEPGEPRDIVKDTDL